MLTYQEKKVFLKKYLCADENSYADIMKEELYFYFFENEIECSFLKVLLNEEEIMSKIDFVISKMILHEHEDCIELIIENYLSTNIE